MFCRNCGYNFSDGSKYCPNCGYNIDSGMPVSNEFEENNVLRHQIVPKFNLIYIFLSNLKTPLFIVLLFLLSVNSIDELGKIFIIFTFIFIFIYAFIKTFIDGIQYTSLEYNFYNTKLEYVDGFFNKEEKSIKYDSIREVIMSKNIFERLFGMGTIRIITSAEVLSGSGSKQRNGIYIRCVNNVENEYQIIKGLIDKKY